MSESLIIRRAEPQDFHAVTTLLVELGRPDVTEQTRQAVHQVYLQHVADPNTGSLVAERDGVPIGFLSLHFRPRLNQVTPEAYVPDLIVAEREHGSGAATALFRRAVELARERGCHKLTLESGYHRQRAHRFYQREGMTDAGKFFVLALH